MKQFLLPPQMRSIRFIIAASFSITTIIVELFIGFTLYNKYASSVEENIETSIGYVIRQVSLNMDYYQSSIRQISDQLGGSISGDLQFSGNQLTQEMDVIMNMRNDIVSIALFSDKGEFILGSPFPRLKKNANIIKQGWFKRAISNPRTIIFSGPHVQDLFEGKYNWVISESRTVDFWNNGNEMHGVLLVDVNLSSIDQLSGKATLGRRGYVYVADSEGKIIYHPQQDLIYAGLKHEDTKNIDKYEYKSFIQNFQNEKRMVTVVPIGYMDWKAVGVSYMNDLVATKKEIISFSAAIIFVGIIFVIAVFIFIATKITTPIKKLERSMGMVEKGSFDVNAQVSSLEELNHLSNAFNLMVARIKELMNQIVIEQDAKRKSELNALQAQINPHFLYNTLDSIVWMAENGKGQDVIVMVTALARLFRISISRGRNIITVREELEHARNYLIIQKVRYKNKFQYQIEAEEDVLDCKTIKLILQPIIENAIYHGIEYMVDEGLITIHAGLKEGKLLFEIIDNGLGMKQEIADTILIKDSKKNSASGVGVKNVNERIKLSYGNEYGVFIESELEKGTKVKIWLPILRDNEREESK